MHRIIVIAGPMMSGKDTVAEIVAEHVPQPVIVRFSDTICTEARIGLAVMRQNPTGPAAQAAAVAWALDLQPDQGADFVAALAADATRPDFDIRDRTPGTRFVLQALGSAWRPEGYWARRVHAECTDLAGRGHTVIMAGCRLAAEYDLFAASGALMVRLDVSPRVQAARALARDGHTPQVAARTHRSETELDHHRFDLRIDTDLAGPADIAAAITGAITADQAA